MSSDQRFNLVSRKIAAQYKLKVTLWNHLSWHVFEIFEQYRPARVLLCPPRFNYLACQQSQANTCIVHDLFPIRTQSWVSLPACSYSLICSSNVLFCQIFPCSTGTAKNEIIFSVQTCIPWAVAQEMTQANSTKSEQGQWAQWVLCNASGEALLITAVCFLVLGCPMQMNKYNDLHWVRHHWCHGTWQKPMVLFWSFLSTKELIWVLCCWKTVCLYRPTSFRQSMTKFEDSSPIHVRCLTPSWPHVIEKTRYDQTRTTDSSLIPLRWLSASDSHTHTQIYTHIYIYVRSCMYIYIFWCIFTWEGKGQKSASLRRY